MDQGTASFITYFLPNFLIALREGTEAALIVGILIGYLKKLGRGDVINKVWIGVGLALIIPLALGAAMTWGPYTMTFRAQEIVGGTLSLVAVGFVTWMIFWMSGSSKEMVKEIRQGAEAALSKGSAWGLIWLAAISVGREGIETAVFIWGVVNSSAQSGFLPPTVGVIVGLAAAFFIGYLIYKGATFINLKLFFGITGIFLVFVASGVVVYGIGDLQEASVLPGHGMTLYDWVSPLGDHTASWWFVLLNAMFNLQYLLNPTALQLIGYFVYIIPVMIMFVYGTWFKKDQPKAAKESKEASAKVSDKASAKENSDAADEPQEYESAVELNPGRKNK